MILTEPVMKELFTSGHWGSNTPAHLLHYNPNSIDITLAPYFYRCKSNTAILDPLTSNPTDYFDLVVNDSYVLKPQEFILASVNETFNTTKPYNNKYFTQIYDGRSTIARLGLLTHISAGYGDYGFNGAFTLEIVNNSPFSIKLHQNMRIGQIYFIELDSTQIPPIYRGYDHNTGIPGLPRLGVDRF